MTVIDIVSLIAVLVDGLERLSITGRSELTDDELDAIVMKRRGSIGRLRDRLAEIEASRGGN